MICIKRIKFSSSYFIVCHVFQLFSFLATSTVYSLSRVARWKRLKAPMIFTNFMISSKCSTRGASGGEENENWLARQSGLPLNCNARIRNVQTATLALHASDQSVITRYN